MFHVQKIARLRRQFYCSRHRIVLVTSLASIVLISFVSSRLFYFTIKDDRKYESSFTFTNIKLSLLTLFKSEDNINLSADILYRVGNKSQAASCIRNHNSFYTEFQDDKNNPLGLIKFKVNSTDITNTNQMLLGQSGLFLNNKQCRKVLSYVTNEQDYKLLLIPKLAQCSVKLGNEKLLMTLVMIAPDRFERREVIRRTWASYSNKSRQLKASQRAPEMSLAVIFVMGRARTLKIDDKIKREHHKYGDILQFTNFNDSYQLLTVKVIGSFWWTHTHCPAAQLIMRINDDVVVNMPILLPFLHTVLSYTRINQKKKHSGDRIIMGNFYPHSPVFRDSKNKFFIAPHEYESDYLVPYVEGSAYVITSNLASEYFNLSRYLEWVPFSTWLEDIYIGGFLSLQLNVSYLNLQRHYSSRVQYASLNVDYVKRRMGYEADPRVRKKLKSLGLSSKSTLYFVYVQRTEQIRAVWDRFMSTTNL